MPSTPTDFRNRAPSISRAASVPRGGTISTMVTNSPSAILRPSCERSRSGGTSTGSALEGAVGLRAGSAAGNGAQEGLHHVDVVGRGAAAAADQAHPDATKLRAYSAMYSGEHR